MVDFVVVAALQDIGERFAGHRQGDHDARLGQAPRATFAPCDNFRHGHVRPLGEDVDRATFSLHRDDGFVSVAQVGEHVFADGDQVALDVDPLATLEVEMFDPASHVRRKHLATVEPKHLVKTAQARL